LKGCYSMRLRLIKYHKSRVLLKKSTGDCVRRRRFENFIWNRNQTIFIRLMNSTKKMSFLRETKLRPFWKKRTSRWQTSTGSQQESSDKIKGESPSSVSKHTVTSQLSKQRKPSLWSLMVKNGFCLPSITSQKLESWKSTKKKAT